MKIKLTVFLILLCASVAAQKLNYTKDASGNLIGKIEKSAFAEGQFKGWFNKFYDSYSPDKKVLKKLKRKLKGVTIVGFMGTWCGDSKRETPSFYKVLEQANFDFKNLTLIAVDRSKKTPDNLEKGLNIIRVPTFIFYKKGKEIGRYVEYPRESLEKDILTIVSGKEYKHSYQK